MGLARTAKDHPMDFSCDQCSAGPAGIAGHPNLWVRSLHGGEMIFRCESCEALWCRSGHASTRFNWAIMNDRAAMRKVGLSVPPRSEPLALFAWRNLGPVRPVAASRS